MSEQMISLDSELVKRAETLAKARACTVQDVLRAALEKLSRTQNETDCLVGIMHDIPDLIDNIVQDAYSLRKMPPRTLPDFER